MQYVITHPPDPKPSLLVETCSGVSDARVEALRKEMHDRGCPNGLLFDRTECVVLRDTYDTLDAGAIVVEARVQTDDLLTRVREAPLDARLGAWLRRTAASWNDALPTDSSAIASFVYDIVPALAGATIREIPTAA